MTKFEIIQAKSEFYNALSMVLSHQLALTQVHDDFQPSLKETGPQFLSENEFERNHGLLINHKKIIEALIEIDPKKMNDHTLEAVNNKVCFTLKSVSDFINMLHFDLADKIPKEIHCQEATILNSSPDEYQVHMINKFHNYEIWAYDISIQKWLMLAKVEFLETSGHTYVYVRIEAQAYADYLLELNHK